MGRLGWIWEWDRESLFEDFAADLNYHPRRGTIYVAVGIGAVVMWFARFGVDGYLSYRAALAFGGIALCIKGMFMFRKKSGGFEAADTLLANLPEKHVSMGTVALNNTESGDPFPHRVAQMIQDFAIGPLLLWPLVRVVGGIEDSGAEVHALPIFVTGALLYATGWALRRLTRKESPWGT